MHTLTIHLIPNAHLDPVWLWDWRDGLNTGWQTCRTILDLMDEEPELTFIRGETALYQHIERHDPETFRRIGEMVRAGRWELVGGVHVQPDTNLPATETFARHFLEGQRYFRSRFGRTARIAWAADSFGHSAGLVEILTAAGFEGYAFSRPPNSQFPLAKPAFWWEATSGARLLSYRIPCGWYGCERDEIPRRMDAVLEAARAGGLANMACFFGLGNHGGGPTRRHLQDLRAWAQAHPEVQVVFSSLARLFDALRAETRAKNGPRLPVHRGEMNFCLRGCYTSMARFKFPYRKTEAAVCRAERTATAIHAALNTPPAALDDAWKSVLFNSFHDILPGTSIESAYEDQLAWIGGARHQAQVAEFAALNALAGAVDTRVPRVRGDHPSAVPFLIWNPHPHPIRGHVDLEANVDARPVFAYRNRANDLALEVRDARGRPVAFQRTASEHLFFPSDPWRLRVVVPVSLPPLGWSILTMGWVEGARPPAARRPAVALPARTRRGATGIQLPGGVTLSAITVADAAGSWGDMDETAAAMDLQQVLHRWRVENVQVLERGPVRTTVWVRLTGGHSRLDLRLALHAGSPAVVADARVLWAEHNARLKLVLTGAGANAEYQVPGGTAVRGEQGEVPGGRWVRSGRLGFASDALYGFNLKNRTLQASVCRASRHAETPADHAPWKPAMDNGHLQFRFLVTRDLRALPDLAAQLEQPPIAQVVPAMPGPLPRTGSLLELAPASLELLALKPAADGRGIVLRARETSGRRGLAHVCWLGRRLALGPVAGHAIATWRITAGKARRISLIER